MKGVPDAPECGFSSMVCKILDGYGEFHLIRSSAFISLDQFFCERHNTMINQANGLWSSLVLVTLTRPWEWGSAGVKYKSRNVLTDQELREGIKTFRYLGILDAN